MADEFLALGAAVGFALGSVAVKVATQQGRMLQGHLVSLATGVVIIGLFALLAVEDWALSPWAIVAFAIAGVAGPGAGRILSIRGVRDAGTAVAIPLQSSSSPLVAVAAGVLLFGESITAGKGLAFLVVLIGLWICVRGGSANRLRPDVSLSDLRRDRMLVVLWPITAGAAYAASDIFKKVGLGAHQDPAAGAFIGLVAALVVWLGIYSVRTQTRLSIRRAVTPGMGWYCLSGGLHAIAATLLMFSLRQGDLVVVAPILSSQPVMIVLLSAVLLRDLEVMRPGIIFGAIAAFGGVGYLALAA